MGQLLGSLLGSGGAAAGSGLGAGGIAGATMNTPGGASMLGSPAMTTLSPASGANFLQTLSTMRGFSQDPLGSMLARMQQPQPPQGIQQVPGGQLPPMGGGKR